MRKWQMKNNHILRLLTTLPVVLAAVFTRAAETLPSAKSNILFIVAEEASHFGATGCSWEKTTNIDQLARQGLVFSNA